MFYKILPYISIVVLILFSAFFSGSEISYAGASQRRMKKSASQGNKKAALALKISENYNKALPTILIGNNLVNIASSSVATVIAIRLMGAGGTAAATVVMTVLILIFGEIIPKLVANEYDISFACKASYLLQFFIWLFTPLVYVVMAFVNLVSKLWNKGDEDDALTENELLTIIETVEDEGVIDEEKSELLQSAIEFNDITVQEILTPRVDIVAIDINDEFDELVTQLLDCKYSRIPVYEDSIDNIIGILHLNHFLKELADNGSQPIDIRPLLHEAVFFHKTMKLGSVLNAFKKRQCHIAIVTDEYGGTMGAVTLEDVVEEIVGDIWDEKDVVVSDFNQIGENLYEVSGDMAIFDFCDFFEIDEDEIDSDYVTLGGLAIEMLDGYPSPGDTFQFKYFTFRISETEDMRVKKMTVLVEKPQDEEDDDD